MSFLSALPFPPSTTAKRFNTVAQGSVVTRPYPGSHSKHPTVTPKALHIADREGIASESPEAPRPFSPYSRAEVLEYWRLCDDRIDPAIDALDLEAPQCGFPWYTMGTLEHQLVNIRHIQHHAAILSARLRNVAGISIGWVGKG